jgi:hypothetical protein
MKAGKVCRGNESLCADLERADDRRGESEEYGMCRQPITWPHELSSHAQALGS